MIQGKGESAVSALPDFSQLKRVAFRVETTGRVKDLRGFGKGNSVPDQDTNYARKFVARLAADEIKTDLDETYQALRDSFGFKRRELESSTDEGAGVIHTPRFDYAVTAQLDPADPSQVVWRREITALGDPAVVRAPEFQRAFGTIFNALVFEFAAPLSVEEFVDRIEEDDRPGVKVRVASDASSCEITLAGFVGAIRVTRAELTIEGPKSLSAASLLDQFFEFVQRFNRMPQLPSSS
jgi:hypothetical protein